MMTPRHDVLLLSLSILAASRPAEASRVRWNASFWAAQGSPGAVACFEDGGGIGFAHHVN
ncbi:MAG: hypothetical protein EXR69_00295 [Myxococcales bacterium]|nr:hypothetical protein [Myxococcales bacterium]